MDEKRRETRKKLIAFTPVYLSEQKRLLGYLEDLTLKGAKVVGEKPLTVDTQQTLLVELPGALPGITARAVVLPARVSRCLPDEDNPQNFILGFEFGMLSPENIRIIEALLQRYHFRHQ